MCEQVVVDFGKILVAQTTHYMKRWEAKAAVDGAVLPKDGLSKTSLIAHVIASGCIGLLENNAEKHVKFSGFP